MWKRKDQENQNPGTVGGEFDKAASEVTAQTEMPPSDVRQVIGAHMEEEEKFIIREEWAEDCARLCFKPLAKAIHPAYALTDDEAETISPKMQAFLQALCDKIAPPLIARMANKYPELFDLGAALGVLYYQKYRFVSRLRAIEARIHKENAEKLAANRGDSAPVDISSASPSPDLASAVI